MEGVSALLRLRASQERARRNGKQTFADGSRSNVAVAVIVVAGGSKGHIHAMKNTLVSVRMK